MQPEIFLSVPLHGHAATPGQAKDSGVSEDADFGRVFARLKGDETGRAVPEIKTSPPVQAPTVEDGEGEDMEILSDEDASLEDADALPDDASLSEGGASLTDRAEPQFEGDCLQDSTMPELPDARSLRGDRPDQSVDPDKTLRAQATQVAAETTDLAAAPNVTGVAANLQAKEPEQALAPERIAFEQSGGTGRNPEDSQVTMIRARSSVARIEAVPEQFAELSPAETGSTGPRSGHGEKEAEFGAGEATGEGHTGKSAPAFSADVAARQEAIPAGGRSPITDFPDPDTADTQAWPRTWDTKTYVPEIYGGRDSGLASAPDPRAVVTDRKVGLLGLPKLSETAVPDPASDTVQPEVLHAAMAATSTPYPLQVGGGNDLPPGRASVRPITSGSNRAKTDPSILDSDPKEMAVTPRNGGPDPRSEGLAQEPDHLNGNIAAPVRSERQVVPATKGAPELTARVVGTIEPVTYAPNSPGSTPSSHTMAASPNVPIQTDQPTVTLPGSGGPVPGRDRQLHSAILLPDDSKQGIRENDVGLRVRSVRPGQFPPISEGQTVATGDRPEIQDGPSRQHLQDASQTKTPVHSLDNSTAQSIEPVRARQNTTRPRRENSDLQSVRSPEETKPRFHPIQTKTSDVIAQQFAASDAGAEMYRVAPTADAFPDVATDRGRQPPVDQTQVGTAVPPTYGQSGRSPQRSFQTVSRAGLGEEQMVSAGEKTKALPKFNTVDAALEYSLPFRENRGVKTVGIGLMDRGAGTIPVSARTYRALDPSVQLSADSPVRQSAVTDRAQASPRALQGVRAEPLEAEANAPIRPNVIDTAETAGDRRVIEPQATLARDRSARIALASDTRSVAAEGRTGFGPDLTNEHRPTPDFEVRGRNHMPEHRHQAADAVRSGLAQPPAFLEARPRTPKHRDDQGHSPIPERSDPARLVSFDASSGGSTRRENMASPSVLQRDMPQAHESLKKKTATAPVDAAMPRALPETTVHAARDTPASEPPAPPSAQHAALARDVAQQLTQVTRSVPGEVTELTLRPEELGHVRMRLSGSDGQIVLQILSERPETHDLMRRHIDIVERAFRDLGYHDIAFDFSFSGQRNSGSQTQGEATPSEDMQLAELPQAPQADRREILVPGRLDIRL